MTSTGARQKSSSWAARRLDLVGPLSLGRSGGSPRQGQITGAVAQRPAGNIGRAGAPASASANEKGRHPQAPPARRHAKRRGSSVAEKSDEGGAVDQHAKSLLEVFDGDQGEYGAIAGIPHGPDARPCPVMKKGVELVQK